MDSRKKTGKSSVIDSSYLNIDDCVKSNKIPTDISSFPEMNPNPVVEIDSEGIITYANPCANILLENSSNMGFDNPFFNGLVEEFEKTSERTFSREVNINHKWYLQSISYITNCNHLRIYAIDITDRKKNETEIERIASFPQKNPNPIVEINAEGNITYANPSALVLLSEIENEGFTNPFLSDLKLEFNNHNERTFSREVNFNQKWYLQSLSYLPGNHHLRIYAIDITEHKRTRESLVNIQRLDSLGMLAGGIAHDFNNLMAGIFGYIDISLAICKDQDVSQYLQKTIKTINRARSLTQQLLTFAKGGAPIKNMGHLFPFVQEAVQFALSGSKISCTFDVSSDLWLCSFDKNQMGQVIENVIINAQQAMPTGGTIKITARNITLTEKEHRLLEKGDYINISIHDSGIGISKEVISKIFDPFFTTKTNGRGLGLATSHSIVSQHGGCIDVDSELEKGSVFNIYLPAVRKIVSTDTRKTPQIQAGNGTVLIMDDEEVMRETIRAMVESFGYSVVCTENGHDLIKFFKKSIEEDITISGMIFDLTIPGGMGGKETLDQIKKLNPLTPVFVVSGYADDPVMKDPTSYGFTASICKPFRRFELANMLDTYLKK